MPHPYPRNTKCKDRVDVRVTKLRKNILANKFFRNKRTLYGSAQFSPAATFAQKYLHFKK